MKVYTKTGDKGFSAFADGTRISKGHLRLESYGLLDELIATIGVLSSHALLNSKTKHMLEPLSRVQDWLFAMSSEVANPKFDHNKNARLLIHLEHTKTLEQEIDQWGEDLPTLRNFLIPGHHILSAQAHFVRTFCRRAERSLVRLSGEEEVREELLIFVNRLSDWFFVLARYFDYLTGTEEKIWSAESLK